MLKIAVDVDGVCANTVPLIIKYFNRRYRKKYKIKDIVYYEVEQMYGKNAQNYFEEIEKELYIKARPVPCSVEVLWWFWQNGCEIVYLTLRKKHFKELTRNWLVYYNYPESNNIITTTNKKEWLLNNRVDFVIEDNPYIAEELSTITTVILYDYPYNRRISNNNKIIRVKNWNNIKEIFKNFF